MSGAIAAEEEFCGSYRIGGLGKSREVAWSRAQGNGAEHGGVRRGLRIGGHPRNEPKSSHLGRETGRGERRMIMCAEPGGRSVPLVGIHREV